MAVRRKPRPVKGGAGRQLHLDGYLKGRADGFDRGKAAGYAQGRTKAGETAAAAAAASAQAAQPEQQAQPAQPAEPRPKPDVLVIAAGMITSLEIGVVQPLRALSERGLLHYELKLEHEAGREAIAEAETIVFVRNVEPEAYRLLEWAHELGKRTVYVIDDNFLEIRPVTPVGRYYADPARRETFVKFLRHAQIVKVDSPVFADHLRNRFNANVVYFPASVDFEWLDGQEKAEGDNDQIVIGYEGGDKEEDFAPVVPALHRILDYYGGLVRLEFFGYLPASLAGRPGVVHEAGGMEYRAFIAKLKRSRWDIGLAPLTDNAFNNGKTNNKYREYGACRIPGIYSDCPVYAPWVVHGVTGYLVGNTEKGWYDGIRTLIENPPVRRRIRNNAEAAARRQFSLQVCMDNWRKSILHK